MNVPPIHVISPVWGTAYVRCFLEVGLTSLLSPGNLSGLGEPRNLLHVFTTEADRQTIESAPIWRLATEVLDCRIDIIGGSAMKVQNPHVTMSECHRQAIALADGREAAMMFYNPDIVFADGGMQSLVRLLAQGKRAVQVIGLRLLKDEVVPMLLARHIRPDGSLAISPRELMAMAIRHLHPITTMHLRDAEGVDLLPQEIIWRVGEEGLIARCFHIHPILVYPRVRNAPFSTTVDDDYLRAACPDPSEEYVVTDSDEFCLCELSGMQRGLVGLPRTGNDIDIARWAWTSARPHHFEHLCRRILLHSKGTSGPEWQAVAARSDAVVREIFEHLLVFEDEARRRAPRAG